MRKTWSYATLLLQFFCPFITSAATLPSSLHLASEASLLSNGSQEFVKCLPRSNVTYPVYDSPLELAMTFGRRPILPWQVITFLETVLVDIKPNAARHPQEYIPHGFYYYHEFQQLGAIGVVPSLYRKFTWANLYLVLHALAEYIVAAPRAYEMCVEINFRNGGLAGAIFLEWWTPDVPTSRSSPRVRGAKNRRLLRLDS